MDQFMRQFHVFKPPTLTLKLIISSDPHLKTQPITSSSVLTMASVNAAQEQHIQRKYIYTRSPSETYIPQWPRSWHPSELQVICQGIFIGEIPVKTGMSWSWDQIFGCSEILLCTFLCCLWGMKGFAALGAKVINTRKRNKLISPTDFHFPETELSCW